KAQERQPSDVRSPQSAGQLSGESDDANCGPQTADTPLGQLSPRSSARAVSALQALAQYFVHTGQLAANPLEGLHPPKYSRPLPDYIGSAELRSVVCAFDSG